MELGAAGELVSVVAGGGGVVDEAGSGFTAFAFFSTFKTCFTISAVRSVLILHAGS